MDLGLVDRKALVCASSQGLGFACAIALAREGVQVTLNSRSAERLAEAREKILAETGQEAGIIVADLSDPTGRANIIKACPQADILINNNGGPPPGTFQDWDENDWHMAVNANMIPALMLIRHYLPGMRAQKFGRIINITSAMVKSPRAPMALSSAARTGLTAACSALVPVVAADNVTINSMLPERFDTNRQVGMAKLQAERQGISYEEARVAIANTIAARRFGRPEEFGATCAYLCSASAGFISGQNIQLDGGSYAGLF